MNTVDSSAQENLPTHDHIKESPPEVPVDPPVSLSLLSQLNQWVESKITPPHIRTGGSPRYVIEDFSNLVGVESMVGSYDSDLHTVRPIETTSPPIVFDVSRSPSSERGLFLGRRCQWTRSEKKTARWDKITGITVRFPDGTSDSHVSEDQSHAVSFDDRQTWKVFSPASSSWVSVMFDDAASISMDTAVLQSLTADQWSAPGGFIPGETHTIDFMDISRSNAPLVSSYAVNVLADLHLISDPWPVDIQPSKVFGTCIIDEWNPTVRFDVSTARDPQEPDWVGLFSGGITVPPGDGIIRVRIVVPHSCGSVIHGYALAWE